MIFSRLKRPTLRTLRATGQRTTFQFDTTGTVAKWIGISLLIGVIAGCGAILFDLAIRLATDVFLGWLAGFSPPSPTGEGDSTVFPVDRRWMLPVVTTIGGFLSGFIVLKFARDAAGGGNDQVIASYHFDGGNIRSRVPPIKLIASAITIGSGGSAGREGPAAMISAGIGSIIARLFRLSVDERRMCVVIGMGAGIGAIFRAPLGGAILAGEVLYRDDMESEAVIPALIASIISYSVFATYADWDPLFATPSGLDFNNVIQLVYFAIIGVLAGLLGIIFARVNAGISKMFLASRAPVYLKPAIGGLIVGLIAIAVPQTLGTGYGWIQIAVSDDLFLIPLWILLLLPLLKIFTTSFTVESGASGGLFGPGMFIGAMMGAGFWRVFHDILPGMPDSPASFTIIGMMAHFGAVAHVPLAVMIMVTEMTRNPTFLAPAMIAVGIATYVVGRETIFRSQLPTHADSPVHRHLYSFPLLATLTVRDAMKPALPLFQPTQSVEEVEQQLLTLNMQSAPVVDEQNNLIGIVAGPDIAAIPEVDRGWTDVSEIIEPVLMTFTTRDHLDKVLDSMVNQNLHWVPVTENGAGGRILGMLTFPSIFGSYREALTRNVRRTDELMAGSLLLEFEVSNESPLCAIPVKDLDLPDDALLVSYTRAKVVRFPHGETVFQPGDLVGVVTSRAAEQRIMRYLENELLLVERGKDEV